MRKFLKEFKDFALRGNVVNLAVGIIIGVGFQDLVSSLTDNIISPILGLFLNQNFDAWHLNIFGVEIRYGAFITSVINFVIMAFIVFMLVKLMNKVTCITKKPTKDAPSTTKSCPFCKTEISMNATRCPACTSQLS
ncbi:MAG: large conductance mechanosensitive channel protein MscL [Defluviitaleaceae bacterium]|nr:large conductance mechanosensitive channel protein MscL [Defluviitaleaceae bacterium]